jgi:two-component system, LytTR family, response regulator LytT
MNLRCIAIDDEPLALALVCNFIQKTPFLNLEGRYSSAIEALHALQNQEIDLIYLDIQMPDLTGIEMARLLQQNNSRSCLIFTTAFNHFAIEGYKVDALDYLLKPFNYEEFLRATNKAKNHVELVRNSQQPSNTPIEVKEDYLFLKVEYQLVKVFFSNILFIEGLKDYVKIHLKNEPRPLLSLTSLKALEEKLPTQRFMRVHRSFIVSLDNIQSISRGQIQINNSLIPISDQYKDNFNAFINKWLS